MIVVNFPTPLSQPLPPLTSASSGINEHLFYSYFHFSMGRLKFKKIHINVIKNLIESEISNDLYIRINNKVQWYNITSLQAKFLLNHNIKCTLNILLNVHCNF